MPGLIRRTDVDEVKARTNLADVIGEQVTLKSAGVGALKGLCPFHDERSPSFHVRTSVGRWHCFGCDEGGDVVEFVMKMDHVSFTDAVERLAQRIGYTLTYEDGGTAGHDTAKRVRLLDANRAAEKFFGEQLSSPGAAPGRAFLAERGFDRAAAQRFGVGWAPAGWSETVTRLRGQGFTDDELTGAGLAVAGERGAYDRFRGRLVWPIRDITGATVGFGARRILDDDPGPKYLNTPETMLYKKAQVLYGLDLAKRDVARDHRVVVVEGYTDVMACHLAGVPHAVATCGTAFGVDHIRVLRRVLGDDSSVLGEVVFTFDPDAAGQKAAVRAFAEEKRFTAQTYVATGDDGLDPCDLRMQRGDAAVRQMIGAKRPMFEFVIQSVLAGHDLDTVEGRAAALRTAAPIVAGIRDPGLRPGYVRLLAGRLGVDLADVDRAVRGSRRAAPAARAGAATEARPPAPPAVRLAGLPNDPVVRLERDALMAIVQVPHLVGGELIVRAARARFASRPLAAVRDAVASQLDRLGGEGWLERLTAAVPPPIAPLVEELAVAVLPAKPGDEQALALTARAVVAALVDRDLGRQKAELVGALQRTEGSSADAERRREIRSRLVSVESDRRSLRGA